MIQRPDLDCTQERCVVIEPLTSRIEATNLRPGGTAHIFVELLESIASDTIMYNLIEEIGDTDLLMCSTVRHVPWYPLV